MTDGPINIYEYEPLARERLSKSQYDFIAGGATDEITLNRTRRALDAIALRPRMMTDVSRIDTATSVLGHPISFPVMPAPSGAHCRAHVDGELATVKAAGSASTVMVLSSGSSYTMEEIAQAATGPVWFQQYFYEDRGVTLEMVHRAEEAGYTAICLTLDIKASSKRERNIRNKYVAPRTANYQWASRLVRDPSSTWEYLEWLASRTSLPLILKGIMTGEEAGRCAGYGAKAVIVSNHGGRQLDTTFATVEVLPEVVDAVRGEVEVYMDGGIRRGSDVVKAVALGSAGGPHREAPILGSGRRRRGRSASRPPNPEGRVGDDHGSLRAPHPRELGPKHVGIELPTAELVAATPRPRVAQP